MIMLTRNAAVERFRRCESEMRYGYPEKRHLLGAYRRISALPGAGRVFLRV